MTRIRLMLNVFAISLVCVLFSSIAHAQATRTWVSGVGDDANPCSRTAPCKTFAGAISKTAAGGEISVLDPGGFGGVTITKAITINGEGTLAGITAAGTNAIIVNAGVNDVVIIRNISINGVGSGLVGIKYFAGKHLHIENCNIYAFPGGTSFGIQSVNSPSTPGGLSVVNTSITNCLIGIQASNAASNVTSLTGVKIQRGLTGIDSAGANVTVKDSVISHQSNAGIAAEGNSVISITGCSINNTSVGVTAFTAGSTIRIANSDIYNNTTGVNVAAGATGDRFGNTRVFGNGTDVNGTLTLRAQQ